MPVLGKFIPKNTKFGDFSATKPTFLKPQSRSLASAYEPWTPSPALNFV